MINIEVLFFFLRSVELNLCTEDFVESLGSSFFKKRLIELYLLWFVSYIIFAFNNTLLLFIIIF